MMYNLGRLDGKEILILGGMGAIGSNIAHTALSLGAKITIFDCMMPNTGANPANIAEIRDKVNFIKGDIRNYDELRPAVEGKHIIFNCAAQVSHVLSMQNPFLDIDINCEGQINVLECCRKHNDSAKIIYAGTRSQFGTAKTPIIEESLDNPADIYSANKLAGELYHLIYHNAYGLATTSIRLTNTYGPRAQMKNPGYSFVNWLIARAILDEDLTVYEPGTQLRDINYIQDAADAMLLACQGNAGEVFVLGSGKGTSVIELANSIVRIAGSGRVKLVPWPAERKKIEAGDIVIDYSKIRNALGWHPKTSIEDGIRQTIDFYRKRKGEYLG